MVDEGVLGVNLGSILSPNGVSWDPLILLGLIDICVKSAMALGQIMSFCTFQTARLFPILNYKRRWS